MENKEVYFEVILPKSSFLNYRLGVTKTVNPDETSLQAWDRAAEEAEQWHKNKHPELYKHNEIVLTVEETDLVTEIANVPDLKKLGMIKNRLTPNTQPYYMEKLKTLTNAFSTHD